MPRIVRARTLRDGGEHAEGLASGASRPEVCLPEDVMRYERILRLPAIFHRSRRHVSRRTIAAAIVSVSLLVPGAAISLDADQGPALNEPAFQGTPDEQPANAPYTGVAGLPRTLWVDRELGRTISRLLLSPTFREQVARLASVPGLYVTVRLDPLGRVPEGFQARCDIKRFRSGNIIADVRLIRRAHDVETIAHELEHIIEYLDGSRLAHLADKPGTGVRRAARDFYETDRAIAAGRIVHSEVRAAEAAAVTALRLRQ
jgi:hypothetical protein